MELGGGRLETVGLLWGRPSFVAVVDCVQRGMDGDGVFFFACNIAWGSGAETLPLCVHT